MLLICWVLMMGEVTLDNGLKLHYDQQGEGPPLLLIAGWGQRLEMWRDVTPLLAEKLTVIAYDARGLGNSGDLAGTYSVDTMADDAASLMAALGFETYHVAGISMGGFVAQSLALRYSDRLERLVLLATSMGGPAHVYPDAEVMAYFQGMGAMTREQAVQRGLALSVHPEFLAKNPEWLEAWTLLALSYELNRQTLMRQTLAAMSCDHTGKLAAIDRPVLILHGEDDRIVVPENGRKLQAALPQSNLLMLKQSGHLVVFDQAQAVAHHVLEFLTQPAAAHQ